MPRSDLARYLFFFLIILFLFIFGGYLFFDHLGTYFRADAEHEQALLAERISDNLNLHLERVTVTVDSILGLREEETKDVQALLERHFHLLWEIYPEISHLIFIADDGRVFSAGDNSVFSPLGLPLEEVFEWQNYIECLLSPDAGTDLHTNLTLFWRTLPEAGKSVAEPIIVFSRNIFFRGEYAGQVLVPYRLDLLFNTYCRSLVLDNQQEIMLIDNRGRTVFSSLPGPHLGFFFPAFGGNVDPLLTRQGDFPVRVAEEDLASVIAALANNRRFSCRLEYSGSFEERDYYVTGYPIKVVVPDWSLLIAFPRSDVEEMLFQVMLPMLCVSAIMVATVLAFSFLVMRRISRVAGENAIFRAGLKASADGVIVLDAQGRCLFVNQACREITGRVFECQPGNLFQLDNLVGKAKGLPGNILNLLSRKERWQGLVRYQKSNQGADSVVSQNFAVIFEEGVKVGYISNLHDITEEQRLKREVEVYSEFLNREVERQTDALVQSQKMETIGLLAAGFAHDFNNLLASIQGHVELVEMFISNSPEKSRRFVEKIRHATQQAADLTRQVLQFARRDVGAVEVVTVAELLEAVMLLLPPSLPAQVSYDFVEDSGRMTLKIGKAAMVQALLNIVLNAAESVPEERSDGYVRIQVRIRFVDSYLAQRMHLLAGKWFCEIMVTDNGRGIPPAMIPRIFDPFFSTKEWSPEKGSGLGLAIAYRMVHNYHGNINVSSEVGIGSTFTVYLPVSEESEKELPSLDKPLHDFDGFTILLVEDEVQLRDSLKVILEMHGARVLEAGEGEAALERLAEHKIDLILLDLVMPKMGGEEFLEVMASRNIKLPVLVMTGTLVDGYRLSRRYPVVMEVMEKPFNQQRLFQLCSSLLMKPPADY